MSKYGVPKMHLSVTLVEKSYCKSVVIQTVSHKQTPERFQEPDTANVSSPSDSCRTSQPPQTQPQNRRLLDSTGQDHTRASRVGHSMVTLEFMQQKGK